MAVNLPEKLRMFLADIFSANTKDEKSRIIDYLYDAEAKHIVDSDTVAMMEGALLVSEMQVRDIMVPKTDVVFLEDGSTYEKFLQTVVDSGHSRFPVFDSERENVLGILLAKDLLALDYSGGVLNVKQIVRNPIFVPESKRLNILLREFKANRNHLALVVDEYGQISGLVSIEDVIEQIVGDIDDEHDYEGEENIRPHGRERYTVQSKTSLEEFSDFFETSLKAGDYETIGGLISKELSHVPKRGEEIKVEGFLFKVLRADKRRVRLFRVTRV